MKKNALYFLAAIALGFLIGRITISQSPQVVELSSTPSMLDSKYYDLEKNAKKNLSDASTVEQKLIEIQKLREEVFQIFLANIALKLDRNFWSHPSLPLAPPTQEHPIDTEGKFEATPVASESASATATELKSETVVPNESANVSVNNRRGVLRDPDTYFSTSKLIQNSNNQLMRRIQGVFRGEARLNQPENKIWKITINSSLNFVDNNWKGNVSIEMADENNVVFSNSNGSGSNNNFYQNPNDQGSLIVESSPKTFLYLKWSERGQFFWGSVYEKQRKDQPWRLIGKIPSLVRE